MKSLKNIIIKSLKLYKHLFYDIIPEFYNINWYKHDFDDKLDYYCWKPIIYLVSLVVSLFDINIVIYRILYILGFMKGVLSSVKTSK